MSNIGNKQTMAKNLNYYIEAKGLEKTQMAQELGFKRSSFYNWCNGTVYPRIDKIEKIADYLGVDKMDLINEHDEFHVEARKINELSQLKRMLIYAIYTMPEDKAEKLFKMAKILE